MSTSRLRAVLASTALLAAVDAAAQGYQLEQYEPPAPGDSLLTLPAPSYGETGSMGIALTTDYGHNPLLGGFVTPEGEFRGQSVIDHQLVGHLDLSVDLFERAQISASLPMTLLEAGTPGFGVTPVSGVVVGDPRLGALVRVLGDAQEGPFELSLGGAAWIPVGVARLHSGDEGLRGLLRVNAGGLIGEQIRWASDLGILLRGDAALNTAPAGPGTVGNAVRFGAGASYAVSGIPLTVGPEVVAMTLLAPSRAFRMGTSSLELTVGARYRFTSALEASVGVGAGIIRSAGTPDLRILGRIAYVLPASLAKESRPADGDRLVEATPEEKPAEAAPVEEKPAEVKPEEPAVVAAVEEKPEPQPVAETKPEEPPVLVAAAEPAPTPAEEPEESPRLESLPKLFFASESAELSDESERALDAVAEQLKGVLRGTLVIEGHSDHKGPDRYNRPLSQQRADAVVRYLIDRGIPASKLQPKGVGYDKPATAEQTEESRAINRRVEFSLQTE